LLRLFFQTQTRQQNTLCQCRCPTPSTCLQQCYTYRNTQTDSNECFDLGFNVTSHTVQMHTRPRVAFLLTDRSSQSHGGVYARI
jgi:hypothetical protein